MSIAEFDDIWKAILGDPLLAALRRKCSLADIRGVVMHASAPFARQVGDLTASLTRETARADAAEKEAKALREAAEPFVRAADAAERNCFPLDGAVFRSALDYDMRALGRDNSEDVYRDSVRTSDLYRLRSIVTRATLAAAGAKEGA